MEFSGGIFRFFFYDFVSPPTQRTMLFRFCSIADDDDDDDDDDTMNRTAI